MTIDKAAVARHLRQLEDNKIVSRRRKDGDNRIILVQLTDYGKEVIEISQTEKEHFASELLTNISETEFNTLKKVLDQLDKNVKHMKDSAQQK